ncbi:unnamed protein product [Ectocarpus sp. 4 AP-2014]
MQPAACGGTSLAADATQPFRSRYSWPCYRLSLWPIRTCFATEYLHQAPEPRFERSSWRRALLCSDFSIVWLFTVTFSRRLYTQEHSVQLRNHTIPPLTRVP